MNDTHALVPITQQLPSKMVLAGQIANHAAANHVFEDYLSRKSDNTIVTQAAALSLFAQFLERAGVTGLTGECLQRDPECWRGVTWGLVEAFVKWLLVEGFSISSVNNRLSAVKTYARLAAKAGVISPADLALIKTVSGYADKEAKRVDERREVTRRGRKKAEAITLTGEQAQMLKKRPDTPQGRRDALLMCLLLEHGLRVGEIARLQVTDFDLKRGELRFYRPKVNKVQRHKLTPNTLRAAKAYMNQDAAAMGRLILGTTKTGRVSTLPIDERGITKRVAHLAETVLGIEGLSAHDCRHHWATDAARNKTDPFSLQEAGGWSSLAMPRRYVKEAEIANQGVVLSVK